MRHVSYFNNIKQQKQKEKREVKETYNDCSYKQNS